MTSHVTPLTAPSARAHLIATILSSSTALSVGEGGPYMWASLTPTACVPQLVTFARALADEILRQEAAPDGGPR